MNEIKKFIKENIEENDFRRCLFTKVYTRGRKYCLCRWDTECGYQGLVLEDVDNKEYYRCKI